MGAPGKPVELTFKFATVRNFSAMVLHTNNMFTKGVQVSLKSKLIMNASRHTGASDQLICQFTTRHIKGASDINNVNRLECV